MVDIIGRQASAVDTIADLAGGLFEIFTRQTEATEDVMRALRQSRSSKAAPVFSDEQVRTMTEGMRPEDRTEIQKAMASKDPAAGIAKIKAAIQAEENRAEPDGTKARDEVYGAAFSRLDECLLFEGCKEKTTSAGKVIALAAFADGFIRWLDSCMDLLPVDLPKDMNGQARSLRSQGLIKTHLVDVMEGEAKVAGD